MSIKLLKSTFVVSAMTFISRISGLIRDVALANFVGTGVAADAFFVAFRIPNFFRRVLGEGAFSVAFVPVYSEFRETRSPGEVNAFLSLLLSRLMLVLVALCLLAVLAAPALVSVIAPGFLDDPEKFALTTQAVRICFPYLFFISLISMSAGILNTHGKFWVPAFTPVFLNLCLIWAVIWLLPRMQNPAIALSCGVVLAGVLQLGFQLPFLKQEHVLPLPRFKARSEADKEGLAGCKQLWRLILPALFGSSVAQINLLINTLLASFLVTGSVSWLYYSDRLMELPVGVFGIALATVILPSLSKQHANASAEAFSNTIDWALRWVLLISLPATLALIVLAKPLIITLFNYGEFSSVDVHMAAQSLVAFAAGLLPIMLVKVLAPGFFARQDTRTPVRVGVIAMMVNAAVGVVLVWPFAHVGLAIAISVAACVNAALLYILLRRENVFKPLSDWWSFGAKVIGVSVVMAVVLYGWAGEADDWLALGVTGRVLKLFIAVAIGMAVYIFGIIATGIQYKQLLVKP